MVQKIWAYMKEKGMLGPGDCVIAGVSGGADSVCLLRVLKQLCETENIPLEAVHVEHGIRGEESRADAVFVETLCGRLSVSCQVVLVDAPSYAKEHRVGLEEAARTLRYEAYRAAARRAAQKGYAPERIRVALAHQEEDQAETVLFQLLRGSGIGGLRGIRPVRADSDGFFYIRPMLAVSRREIEAYLEEIGQDFRTDATNLDAAYTRNRIRREILPKLCGINGRATSHIRRTAEQLERIEDYLAQQAAREAERIVTGEGRRLALDIPGLMRLHPAIREEVLKSALFRIAGSKRDILAVHIGQLLELAGLQSGRRIDLPYRITAFREYDRLILEKADSGQPPAGDGEEAVFVSPQQLSELLERREPLSVWLSKEERLWLRVLDFDGETEKIPKKTYTKWLDYDKIKNGFTVRKRMAGDYFCMDAQGRRKKLKRYFTEERIPSGRRGGMWLAAQESKVLWLIGGRISEDVKLSGHTQRILELKYEGGNEYGFQQEV